jgi:hypothetical protein
MTRELPSVDRARAYVEKMPDAISGKDGSGATFAVACRLVEFGLSWDDAWALLLEYNLRCQPQWSERELRHKLDDAFRRANPRPDFSRLARRFTPPAKVKIDPATAVENFLKGFRCEEVDLWEASPVRPPDDWTKDALALLAFLFEPGERVNFVIAFTVDKDGKAKPKGSGETVERDSLLARWQKHTPCSEAGGWLRMNPMDGQGVADVNVTAFRFALIECDAIPLELQLPLLAKLPLPIAAILTSGGRSLHAWVKVDAANGADYRQTVARMLALLARFGVDGKNKNPSRLSRLPGVQRIIGATGDGRQRLLYLNPQPTQKAIL